MYSAPSNGRVALSSFTFNPETDKSPIPKTQGFGTPTPPLSIRKINVGAATVDMETAADSFGVEANGNCYVVKSSYATAKPLRMLDGAPGALV
jgi:hypothetical protein